MSTPEAIRRARMGEAWLDETPDIPDDWRKRVDPDSLDIRSGIFCVIGQIVGGLDGYVEFVDTYPDAFDPIELGFSGGPSDTGDGWVSVSSQELTEAWFEILTGTGDAAR